MVTQNTLLTLQGEAVDDPMLGALAVSGSQLYADGTHANWLQLFLYFFGIVGFTT